MIQRPKMYRASPPSLASNTPSLKQLIQDEVVDFFAGFGSPGGPETPEAMQRELTQRIENVFDFYLNQKTLA
ncbi:MAG: hypothetical protein RSD49_14865 [Hafnia sp.]